MKINCTKQELQILKKIARAAEALEMETYLIGGFVRDKILGRPTNDIDIVCIGNGIELAKKVAKHFDPVPHIDVFKNFGTAHFILNLSNNDDSSKVPSLRVPELSEGKERSSLGEAEGAFDLEFVGARKESYRSDSRKPEVVPGTVEDDQNRRDFTMNALAISLNKDNFGKLIDPFGGVKDLDDKIIRTPLDPVLTFSDDPLRMMRAIRFASELGFVIEEKTWQGIKDTAERIKIISQERITDELNKIIASPKPSVGFDLLYKTGLLQIIFPQMVDLAGAEYKDGLGHKDNFYHTLQVLDNLSAKSDDLWLRWAAVLHDIAKPATKKFEEGHGWTFHGHEAVGGRMLPKIFGKLKLPQNEKMRFVRKMVELHLRPISLTKENITDSAIRRLLFDAGEDIDSLMLLCEADITSKNKTKVKRYLENFQLVRERCKAVEEKDHIRNWQPPVSGDMIMELFGLPPSKPVGILKDVLKDAMLDGIIPNTREAALAFVIKKAGEMGLKVKNP